MTLDMVKWMDCRCGRSYPTAHFIPAKIGAEHIGKPDEFKRHSQDKCTVCRRKGGELPEGVAANGSL